MPDRSFDDFARASLPALARYAYALTGGVQPGEDLLQDTLVKLSRAWRRVRHDGNPLGYARVVMTRTYISAWRSATRRPSTVPLAGDHPAADAYSAVDTRDAIRRVLATLPRDQRAVLVLGYLDDLPDEEIAAILDRRPTTVRSLRFRALATLRRYVADESLEDLRGQA